jgi:uracil-DNA glycosylase family 4
MERDSLERINEEVVVCRRCPRLVSWREEAAAKPPRRYQGERYWAKPLPGFGDHRASVLVLGLAPAAHGGNRTGRMFTGDRSGDWLYEALFRTGFANQAVSVDLKDGLKLTGCYISASVRCAPPGNKPERGEYDNCRPYLVREIAVLDRVRVVVALGKVAFDAYLKAFAQNGGMIPKPRPRFGHGVQHALNGGPILLASYHPSQQNTFTGKLTKPMLHGVFETAKRIVDSG